MARGKLRRIIMKVTVPRALSVCLLVASAGLPAAAQSNFTNLFATVSAPNRFAFPLDFHATRAIAVYDTNHNGFLDTAAGSSSNPFHVAFTGIAGLGNRVGSEYPVPGPLS